jgi:hypothetical protein
MFSLVPDPWALTIWSCQGLAIHQLCAIGSLSILPYPRSAPLVDMDTPPTDWDMTTACHEFLLHMIPSGVMSPASITQGIENWTDLWVMGERIRNVDRKAQRLLQFEGEAAYVMPKMMELMESVFVIYPAGF